ncbi:hypothetical protein OVA13_11815 [Pseudoxanthomonas sp. SL93]|uniref:hypothetical protein n=1 Tax=Pseudoxanthomonas sp. SL93 TaxID=2995142 RepID=UPI00226F6F08|nr:hypothetical protein [Pseudoxanthomonas sp. SL93]WAC62088.1 hypothetical protein OVA13_11815 [Pseudoxanthomonas sp. SL93]
MPEIERSERAELATRCKRYFRNLILNFDWEDRSLIIKGPSFSHLDIDHELLDFAETFGCERSISGVSQFHMELGGYDLSFEDSWSGFYIAKRARIESGNRLTILHFDAHVDIMPAPLWRDSGSLRSLIDGQRFSVLRTDCWQRAIENGTVGIGNFFTPFFHDLSSFTVMHVTSVPTEGVKTYRATPSTSESSDLRGIQQISVEMQKARSGDDPYTYARSNDLQWLLDVSPSQELIGHIDLDYFVNYFDGRSKDQLDKNFSLDSAFRSIDRIADTLSRSGVYVSRWILATSPGFCPARAWNQLINRFASAMEA